MGTIMRILHTSDWHLGTKFTVKAAPRSIRFSGLAAGDRAGPSGDAIIVAGDALIPVRRQAMPENFITVSSLIYSKRVVICGAGR